MSSSYYWGAIIVSFLPLLLTAGIVFVSMKLNFNRRVPAIINAIIYLITLLSLLVIIPMEVLNLWRQFVLGPDVINWLWGFIPYWNVTTVIELFLFCMFRILVPCCCCWFGIKFFVIGVWRDEEYEN